MLKEIPQCASPDCTNRTPHHTGLCVICYGRREARFAADDAQGDAMARRAGHGPSSTACDDQLAPDPGECLGGLHYPPGAEELTLGRKADTDRLADIAIELLQSATEAYQQALALMKQGKRSEGQQLQLWADTLRSAGEQVGDEVMRLELALQAGEGGQ